MTTRRDFLKAASVFSASVLGGEASRGHDPACRAPDSHTNHGRLRVLCEQGLKESYADRPERCRNDELAGAIRARLEHELQIINELSVANYFLLLWDIFRFGRENDIPASLRGPAAGSLVVYALGISPVCPIRHGLLFERFIRPGEGKVPDIVIDVGNDDRDGVIGYLRQRCGKRPVASSDQQDRPDNVIPEIGVTLAGDFVKVVCGRWVADDQVGVDPVKVDLLGLDGLGVLSRTLGLVAQRCGAKIDLENIPDKDAKTFALLQRSDTDGVFQFEDVSARELLWRVRPESINGLIAITALNRPGPLREGIAEAYISVRRGREEVAYQHPAQEEILGETLGIMVYQEQAMLILHRLGGIELGDAYGILRSIGRKNHALIDLRQAEFLVGCRERGVTENVANDVFNKILFFAGDCSCKAHAASEATVSYRAAYLKAHYPAEFAEAVGACH